jgi:hypothetical protein
VEHLGWQTVAEVGKQNVKVLNTWSGEYDFELMVR